MIRQVTAGVLIAGGAGLLGFGVVPAFADAPTTRTVDWLVTSNDFGNRFGTPQTLYTGSLQCGVGLIQQDVYRYATDEDRATVDNLIASGRLDNASEDGPVYVSSVDITLTPCTTPTGEPSSPSTPVATSSPTSQPTPPAPTLTPSAPAATPPTPRSTPTGKSVAQGVPTPTATTAALTNGSTNRLDSSAGSSLAYTGSHDGPIAATGLLLLAGGLSLLVVARRRKATR